MTMSEPRSDAAALEVRGLEVSLGGTEILSGIDLDVPSGRTVAVLGPSGCGKTTLLRSVAGLVDPAAGRVLIRGIDVTRRPAHRRGVGLMFQDNALFPHRSVGANVAFGLRMAGASRAEQGRRTAEVLELVGLGGWQDRTVGSLSGGEAQRVALARALAPAPKVLCLDEPLGSLDRVLHDRLVDELRRLFTDLDLTVLYVTHDQREALAVADRLVVMSEGTILQGGTAEGVWRNPASERVARFLGQDVIIDVELSRGLIAVAGTALLELGGVAAPDGEYRMIVRPDAVELCPPGEPDGSVEPLTAIVTDVAFEGERTSVRLRPEVAIGELRAHVTHPPVLGQRVGVRIRAEGISLLSER